MANSDQAEGLRIVWEPQPGPQTHLITCPTFEVFFAGARGGGKTDGCLGDWASHASELQDSAIGLWVRRQRIELTETMERSKVLYSGDGAFNEQEKMWRFNNGARLRFAYLENDKDAEAYQGHSYTRVYVEELTNFPSQAPVMKLMATLRSGNEAARSKLGFRATGNPGGPGHGWVKSRYIEPAPKGYEILTSKFIHPWTREILERERVFIPSFVYNNRYLGAEYIANLSMAGPPELVRAWLEGDWNVSIGTFFPELSEAKHRIPDLNIPEHWARFAWYDWGCASPSCCLWAAVSDGERVWTRAGEPLVLPRGALVVYRELYICDAAKPHMGANLVNREQAALIRQAAAGDKVAAYWADLPSFRSQGNGITPAKEFAEEGINLRLGEHSRVPAWSVTRSRIKGLKTQSGVDVPMLYFCESAKHTWRTMLLLQANPDNLEDACDGGEDHAPDCVRGLCTVPRYIRDAETPNNQIIQQAVTQRPTMANIMRQAGNGFIR